MEAKRRYDGVDVRTMESHPQERGMDSSVGGLVWRGNASNSGVEKWMAGICGK